MCWIRKTLKVEGLWNGCQFDMWSTLVKFFRSVWSWSQCWVWCHQYKQIFSVPCIMHLHSVVHYCTLLATILTAWCSLFPQTQEGWNALVEKMPANVLNKSLGFATKVHCTSYSAAAETRDKIIMCSETSSSVISLNGCPPINFRAEN